MGGLCRQEESGAMGEAGGRKGAEERRTLSPAADEQEGLGREGDISGPPLPPPPGPLRKAAASFLPAVVIYSPTAPIPISDLRASC